jgi:16S rRNA (uracil1498-N3)-methyltransferase
MSLPYFFIDYIGPHSTELVLDEETSKHIVQVLRMQKGKKIRLTDGKGRAVETEIVDAHKKHCLVHVISSEFFPRESPQLTIAISLIKNVSRFEWFLEKATELGTAEIVPLICERTERLRIRQERLVSICKSAMLQSMQTWMPSLHEARPYMDVIKNAAQHQKMIAHCAGGEKRDLSSVFDPSGNSHIILIGPEGDFSDAEIAKAMQLGFDPVSLGNTRLRTETAGIVAAAGCRRRES